MSPCVTYMHQIIHWEYALLQLTDMHLNYDWTGQQLLCDDANLVGVILVRLSYLVPPPLR